MVLVEVSRIARHGGRAMLTLGAPIYNLTYKWVVATELSACPQVNTHRPRTETSTDGLQHMEVEMDLTIKTLTPLWTGGVDGKIDRIHETGILGSLRWWYEILVRGLGGQACDPISENRCAFDVEEYKKSQATDKRQRLRDAGLCDVCQVFGATGWRRRFLIAIVEENVSDARIGHTVRLTNRQYTDNKGKLRTPTWYFRDPTQKRLFPNTPKTGHFTAQIQSLDPDFPPEVIAGLIQFIADWAAIGARAQMGFGIVELENGRIDTRPLFEWLKSVTGGNTYADLPSLQNIFLARISPKGGSKFSEQDTFNLKYNLRRLFASDGRLRHFIMGTVKGSRMAAKIKMSRPYDDGLMRVWGWIPEEANVYQDAWDRNTVVDAIHNHLKDKYNLQVWREVNSPRDTVNPNNIDAQAFLQSLLGLEEESDAA